MSEITSAGSTRLSSSRSRSSRASTAPPSRPCSSQRSRTTGPWRANAMLLTRSSREWPTRSRRHQALAERADLRLGVLQALLLARGPWSAEASERSIPSHLHGDRRVDEGPLLQRADERDGRRAATRSRERRGSLGSLAPDRGPRP